MRMWVPNLFISELFAVNADASRAVAISCVTSLHHKVSDDTMEAVTLVVPLWALLTRAQCPEILASFWHISKELENYTALLEALLTFITNRDIKEGLRVLRLELG